MSNGQPQFVLLPEGAIRNTGKSAQQNNIDAAKKVAETVKTTLGPKGMDKMLVSPQGQITVTNDGVTILEEMQVEHPAARMIVEVARTQEAEVGDGTTTAVVLAGELLNKAEQLLSMEIHPTVIVKGYRLAAEHALKILDEISEPVEREDKAILEQIAATAMTGKGAENAKEHLADLVVRAALAVGSLDDVKVEKKAGGSVEDTELVEGIILMKERAHISMPEGIVNPKIALLNLNLEVQHTETEASIHITDPDQMQKFLAVEQEMIRNMVSMVLNSGANVILCHGGIDDLALHYFAKKGIYALKRVLASDMIKLAKATGGKLINKLEDLSPEDLGTAGQLEECKVGDEMMTYIRDCPHAKSVTLLVRGSTEHVVDEAERAVVDALKDVLATLKGKKCVAGAGAPEMTLSTKLHQIADGLLGREQLAVRAFADAMEVIPRGLAENAGKDPIDVVTEMKSLQNSPKGKRIGVNVLGSEKVLNAWDKGIIEPLKVKTQAISSATEVTTMILRIDDVIASKPGK